MVRLSRLFLIIFILNFNNDLYSQRIDTVIDKKIYKSFYSYQLKSPYYVIYYLHMGGGDCSRNKLSFKSEYKSASSSDYTKSGFDKGHLVNAEDFAFDCSIEKLTFSFYNCIPQHPKLNRGSWKSWESTIRKESQVERLKIYTGAIYGPKSIGNGVRVPLYCWKVVYSTKTGLIKHSLLFTNDDSQTVKRVTISQLKQLLQHEIFFNPS